jgi:hypothetical protein
MRPRGSGGTPDVRRRDPQEGRTHARLSSVAVAFGGGLTKRARHAALSKPEEAEEIQLSSRPGPQRFNQERHLDTRHVYKQDALPHWPSGMLLWPNPSLSLGNPCCPQTHAVALTMPTSELTAFFCTNSPSETFADARPTLCLTRGSLRIVGRLGSAAAASSPSK